MVLFYEVLASDHDCVFLHTRLRPLQDVAGLTVGLNEIRFD